MNLTVKKFHAFLLEGYCGRYMNRKNCLDSRMFRCYFEVEQP